MSPAVHLPQYFAHNPSTAFKNLSLRGCSEVSAVSQPMGNKEEALQPLFAAAELWSLSDYRDLAG